MTENSAAQPSNGENFKQFQVQTYGNANKGDEMSADLGNIRSSMSSSSEGSNNLFYALAGGVVVVGILGGLAWATMSPKGPSGAASGVITADNPEKKKKLSKADRKAQEAAVNQLRAQAAKARGTFTETKLADQHCDNFRWRRVRANQKKFDAWNEVLLHSLVVQQVESGLLSQEAALELRLKGELPKNPFNTAGKQLSGIGAGMKYIDNPEKCESMEAAIAAGERELPEPPVIAALFRDNQPMKVIDTSNPIRTYTLVSGRLSDCAKLPQFTSMRMSLNSYRSTYRPIAMEWRKAQAATDASAENIKSGAFFDSAWGDADDFKATPDSCKELRAEFKAGIYNIAPPK